MLSLVMASALVGALSGCSAPLRPDLVTSSPSPAVVQVPTDGINLKMLGLTNGPVDAFSLPRTLVISTRVDEPSGVTLVLSKPAASEVAGYLLRTLPQTGFVVTAADQAAATLTFTGYGWHGSFTGTGDSSAVILRP